MISFGPGIQIPDSELEFSFVRSSGPGGQNVNKVSSKAVLRWNPSASQSLPEDVRPRILSKLGPKLNQEGELVITSDRTRSQIQNREDCERKLQELLEATLRRPKPRKKTRPSRSSVAKAKESKRKDSRKKQLRKPPREA